MHKFKCEKCSHVSDEVGYCPKDGSQLVETKEAGNALEKLLGQIPDLVKTNVESTLKEYGLEKGPAKKIFGNGKAATASERKEYVKSILSEKDKSYFEVLSDEKEQEKFLGKAVSAYFFKHIIAFQVTKDPEHLQHIKALATVDADGGYTIPQEFRAELVRDIKDQPFLRNLVTVIPMSGNYLELPTLINDVKTSWGSENTSISTTTATFGQLTFTPYRLNTFLYTSRELVNDSALNIIQLITRLFTEAIGREEDRVIIAGSGTGQPKGILQETLGGIDNANVDANLGDNVVKLTYKLGKSYRQGARWLINSISLSAIRTIKTTAGDYVFKENGLGNGGEPGVLAGYPVEEQNDLPLDTFIFGNLSYYYLGDRENITVETTTEGAGTFEKHQVAIKVVERIDGKVALTNAFKTLTNAGVD